MPLTFQQSQSFSNGIADDRYAGNGFCSDAEGVNIRKQSKGVVLSNNTRETGVFDTAFMGPGNAYRVYAIIETLGGTTNLSVSALYDTGIINTETGTMSEYSGSLSGGRNLIKVNSGGATYGVIVRSQGTNGIWRWNDTTSSVGTASSYMSLSNNTSDYRPVLVSGGFMYVGGNGTVDAIDISTSTWILSNTVSIPGQCRAITEIGDQIFIYSEDGSTGYKMGWNGVTNFPEYIQRLADNPVLNVANMGNYDYMITGMGENNILKYRRLFLSQGYDKQLIAGGDFIEYEKQPLYFSPIHTNAIEISNNIVYIGGRHCIHTYGSNKSGLPTSLSKDIIIDDSEQITAMYLQGASYLYISYYTSNNINKIIKQDIRDGHKYGEMGYISTTAMDGGDIETEKVCNKIVVGYRLPSKGNDTTSIDIYTKINNDNDWVFIVSGLTNKPIKGDKYITNGLEYVVKSYNDSIGELICSREANGPYNNRLLRSSGLLTKTYGVGDTNINYTDVTNYKFIYSITDKTKRKVTITYQENFYDMEIKAVLKTTDITITPELYSIKALFDYIDPQNG